MWDVGILEDILVIKFNNSSRTVSPNETLGPWSCCHMSAFPRGFPLHVPALLSSFHSVVGWGRGRKVGKAEDVQRAPLLVKSAVLQMKHYKKHLPAERIY